MLLTRRKPGREPAARLFVPAPPAPVAGDGGTSPPDGRSTEIAEIVELLETDIAMAAADIAGQSAESVRRGRRTITEVTALAAGARGVAERADHASHDVNSIAAATEELSATGREIAGQAARSSALTQRAVADAGRSAETVEALTRAAESIGTVLKLIQGIAARTNLLALNATIEAARAGEAGKGFAVVAAEVKALSRQTREATEDIARRIQDIQSSTANSAAAIHAVERAIGEIESANTSVAAAVTEQDATLSELARGALAVARAVGGAAEDVRTMAGQIDRINGLTEQTARQIHQTDTRVSELRAQLMATLRRSVAGNRRRHPRVPLELQAFLVTAERRRVAMTALDLSLGGALLRLDEADDDARTIGEMSRVTVELVGIGEVQAVVVGCGGRKIHLRFTGEEPEWPALSAAIARHIERVMADDDRFIAAAKTAAARVSAAFEAAIARGEIGENALFDATYAAIPQTDPEQVMAPYTALTDRILPDIQEPLLAFDPRVVFCAAVDRNGYLPTHNRKYSLPQRLDDPAWNAANARNRRIFNDRAGLTAGRCGDKDHLLQTYERDMGQGQLVVLKEVDAPVRVHGQFWGGFRLAYRC